MIYKQIQLPVHKFNNQIIPLITYGLIKLSLQVQRDSPYCLISLTYSLKII